MFTKTSSDNNSLFAAMRAHLIKKSEHSQELECCKEIMDKLTKICEELEEKGEKYEVVCDCITCAIDCLSKVMSGEDCKKFELKEITDSHDVEKEVQKDIEEQNKEAEEEKNSDDDDEEDDEDEDEEDDSSKLYNLKI